MSDPTINGKTSLKLLRQTQPEHVQNTIIPHRNLVTWRKALAHDRVGHAPFNAATPTIRSHGVPAVHA
jgi:hypothetical protein